MDKIEEFLFSFPFKSFKLREVLGQEVFHFLLDKIGSFEEIEKRMDDLIIGGLSAEKIKAELSKRNISVDDQSMQMLNSPNFITLPKPTDIQTIRLNVTELGFSEDPTTDQVYNKALELGLQLCPGEAGPRRRLTEIDETGKWCKQPPSFLNIAMSQIDDRYGEPHIFSLVHIPELGASWAKKDTRWSTGKRGNVPAQFLFRIPT